MVRPMKTEQTEGASGWRRTEPESALVGDRASVLLGVKPWGQMAAHPRECAEGRQTVPLKMVRMVNFMLCLYYHYFLKFHNLKKLNTEEIMKNQNHHQEVLLLIEQTEKPTAVSVPRPLLKPWQEPKAIRGGRGESLRCPLRRHVPAQLGLSSAPRVPVAHASCSGSVCTCQPPDAFRAETAAAPRAVTAQGPGPRHWPPRHRSP